MVTLDQRWHGRGIRSPRFTFADCADDVVALLDVLASSGPIVAGYSMGGAIAQLVWHQHPERVAGLVLCSTARNFRGLKREKLFFPVLTGGHPDDRRARAHPRRAAGGDPARGAVDGPVRPRQPGARPSSAAPARGSFPEVLGELGRFNSAGWIGEVDVPTAVVVTERDHTIPQRRQRRLAASIEGASLYTAPGGHASIVLRAGQLGAGVPRRRSPR